MQPLQQHGRLRKPEGLAVTGQQRQGCGPPGELLSQPPLLVAEILGRGAMAQLIPVQIAFSRHGRDPEPLSDAVSNAHTRTARAFNLQNRTACPDA